MSRPQGCDFCGSYECTRACWHAERLTKERDYLSNRLDDIEKRLADIRAGKSGVVPYVMLDSAYLLRIARAAERLLEVGNSLDSTGGRRVLYSEQQEARRALRDAMMALRAALEGREP